MNYLVVAAVMAVSGVSSAMAAPLSIALKPADPAQVYELNSGNFLGLWGIEDGSYGFDTFTGPESTQNLIDTFTTGSANIVGLYYATPPFSGKWVGDPDPFTAFGTMFQVQESNGSSQLTDSFWVEWTGGTLGWAGLNGQTGNNESFSMAASATLDGDPLAAVPLPASALFLLSALSGVQVMRRRRKS